MCIACRGRRPKDELLRVYINEGEAIVLDETGKGQGRGAYICRNGECAELARKKRSLSRVFKRETPTCLYDEVEEAVRNDK